MLSSRHYLANNKEGNCCGLSLASKKAPRSCLLTLPLLLLRGATPAAPSLLPKAHHTNPKQEGNHHAADCSSVQHKGNTERSLSSACTAKSTSQLHWLKACGCVCCHLTLDSLWIFSIFGHMLQLFPFQLHCTFNPVLS